MRESNALIFEENLFSQNAQRITKIMHEGLFW